MRWITFIILLYLAAGLTSAHFLGWPQSGAPPFPRIEYVAILVIFYSLFGEENQAPIFALAAGAALDLLSSETTVLGIHTMSMGLMSLAIVKIRLSIFREQIFSQMVITFMAVMLFALIVGMLGLIAPDFKTAGATTRASTQLGEAVGGGHMGFWRHLGLMTGNAIYTGVVAPAFFWVFLKMRGMMGIAIQTKRGR